MNNEFGFSDVRKEFLSKKEQLINREIEYENAIEEELCIGTVNFLQNALEDFKKCSEFLKFDELRKKGLENGFKFKDFKAIEITYKFDIYSNKIINIYCEIYDKEHSIKFSINSSNIGFELTDNIMNKVIENFSNYGGYQAIVAKERYDDVCSLFKVTMYLNN